MTICLPQVDLPPLLEHLEGPCITYAERLLGDEVVQVLAQSYFISLHRVAVGIF